MCFSLVAPKKFSKPEINASFRGIDFTTQHRTETANQRHTKSKRLLAGKKNACLVYSIFLRLIFLDNFKLNKELIAEPRHKSALSKSRSSRKRR